MIVYKGKAKDFPVFMKNLRKQYAKKRGQLITKKTLLSEVILSDVMECPLCRSIIPK